MSNEHNFHGNNFHITALCEGNPPDLQIPQTKGQCLQSLNSDVIMSTMASRITSISIVYSTICSGTDQRKHQCSASLTFVRGIHWWLVNSPHKGPVTGKCFHLMMSPWSICWWFKTPSNSHDVTVKQCYVNSHLLNTVTFEHIFNTKCVVNMCVLKCPGGVAPYMFKWHSFDSLLSHISMS